MPETTAPLPPDELIDRVTAGVTEANAQEMREVFRSTGAQSVCDIERALATVGRTLDSYERVLEFGCGCGRIMAWLESLGGSVSLHGTDIDEAAIDWCRRNLPFAQFAVNPHEPPMEYPDSSFDLVFNHSVFTHLDERHQDLWLAELRRVTKPGGTLVLTVHGEQAFEDNERAGGPDARAWRERLERDGILFIEQDSFVGSAFPAYYHTTFHAPWYVFAHWGRLFDVRSYLPGAGLGYQDVVVLERPADDAPGRTPVAPRPGSPERAEAPGDSPLGRVTAQLDAGVVPRHPSRFGRVGELARKVLLRVMRPYTALERELDRDLAEAIADTRRQIGDLDARAAGADRMPPVVQDVLNRQSERIKRLEADLRELTERIDRGG